VFLLCVTCKQDKDETEFHLDNRDRFARRNYRRDHCRSCETDRRRRYSYNLAEGEYAAIFAAQCGNCAICEVQLTDAVKPHIDHDHSCCSGRKSCGNCIRGILCGHCNTALGYFQDDPDTLNRAIRYLNRERNPREK
jgi:hypothetical protein